MDRYLIYLRKSRADADAAETTLDRHRQILTEFAKKNGYFVEQTLEEVVSGESLAARPEMQRALELVSSGDYAGVICMDIDRLSRGDGIDSGYIMQVLRFAKCKIVTPGKVYSLDDEQDEQFADLKFFFSKYEKNAIVKRMRRGVVAAAKEGLHPGGIIPYGYEKKQLKKGYTLVINEDEAKLVRVAFEMSAAGCGATQIADRLNALGFVSKRGNKANFEAIRVILRNEVYKGYIRLGEMKTEKVMENGKIVKKLVRHKDYDLYKGIHEPIVSEELWNRSSEQFDKRVAPVPHAKQPRDPFAGILYCKECGKKMRLKSQNEQPSLRFYFCPTRGCKNKGLLLRHLEPAVLEKMRDWLDAYRINLEPVRKDYTAELQAARKHLEQLQGKQAKICRFLEDGVYTVDMFTERNKSITDEIRGIAEAIEELEREQNRPDIAPKVVKILEGYEAMDVKTKNMLWKEVLDRIQYWRDPETKEVEIVLFPRL